MLNCGDPSGRDVKQSVSHFDSGRERKYDRMPGDYHRRTGGTAQHTSATAYGTPIAVLWHLSAWAVECQRSLRSERRCVGSHCACVRVGCLPKDTGLRSDDTTSSVSI